MSWLREKAVDLLEYLPAFLASDKEFLTLSDTLSDEHERIRVDVHSLLDELFVTTETSYGLSLWESVLELSPPADATVDERRRNVMLRLQSKSVSTLAFMTALAKRCIAGGDTSIEEQNEKYIFQIITSGSIVDSKGLMDALDLYKPAHRGYKILVKYLVDMSDEARLYSGLVELMSGKKRIYIPAPEAFEKTVYAGVGYARTGKNRIGIAPPESAASSTYVGAYTIRAGRIQIGGIR